LNHDEAVHAYTSGKTCEELAVHYKVSNETVRRLLLHHHPEIIRPRGPRKKDPSACTTFLTLGEEMRVVDYYRVGKSLDEIERLVGISDSTANKIIRHLAPQLLRSPIHPPKPIKPQPSVLTPEKAFLIGHLIADGSVMRNHAISYCNKNRILVEKVAEVFEKVYGIPVPKMYLSKDGVFTMRWYRKKAWEDLMRYTEYGSRNWVVPNEIITNPAVLGPPFLRALADDDGCVVLYPRLHGWYRWICLRTISQPGRLGLIHLLSSLAIGTYETVNAVIISGRKNIERFRQIIGFSQGVKILRGRWRGWDKAEILELLLQSYRGKVSLIHEPLPFSSPASHKFLLFPEPY
jgi:transposase